MPINVQIRVIVPAKALFDFDKWTRKLKHTLHTKTQRDLKVMFRQTVEGWKGPPTFFAHYFESPSSVGVQVYSSQKKYGIVNAGSPKHTITGKRGLLRFQSGYFASTYPGSLYSTVSFRFGGFVSKKTVQHKGFPGRKFDEQVAEIYDPIFAADIAATFEGGLP